MKKDEILSYFFIFIVILTSYTIRGIDFYHFPSKIMINCSENINYFECQMALKRKIELEKLTAYELELIPKISDKLSAKIINYKNRVKKLEDLKKIRGIGDKTFILIKQYVKLKKDS